MAKIKVELNIDRIKGGFLRVIKSNGDRHWYSLSIVKKAPLNDASQHGNRLANQLNSYGDTS